VPTTLRDLLDEPSLALELLIDGDLDRPIRWVHVTELADASPYLVGDELVLTAGVWRGRRNSADAFVRSLGTRNVAGIGYGLLIGDDRVPSAVVRACREADVPLVGVPVSTPFVAISQLFVERLAHDREQSLRLTIRLTADLIAAAENPSAPAALTAVARILRRSTGGSVWISDDSGRLLAQAGHVPDAMIRRRAAEGAATERAVIDGWAVQPVEASGARAAVLAVADGADLETRSRIDAARPVIGLILARERAVRESERRLAGEVISLVLGRQVEAAAARMPYYALDPGGPLVSLVGAVTDREHALESAERWLVQEAINGVIALRGDELMVVLDGHQLRDPASLVTAASGFGRRVSATAVGTGSVCDDLSGLRRSLVQARQACQLARRRGGGAVVSHEMSGSHALLLALQDQDVLDAFRESLLAPLEEHDAQQGSELVTTLRTFLEAGGRWQETAQALHVHVNTLRNRLDRVEALTSRRLDSTPDRVDLWLALQANTAGNPALTSGVARDADEY
jgi:hypothetical protein